MGLWSLGGDSREVSGVWYNLGMKFSLIVTAHNEAALLEATLKSVFRAVLGEDAGAGGEEGAGTTKSSGGVGGSSEVASDRGLGTLGQDFEILVMIDRGDAATKECAARYREKVRILESNFGDVGPARNYAAEQARGEMVFFVDGDDLVSRGYVEGALGVLGATDEEIVVCPEYCIGFSEDGRTGSVLKMANSGTRERDAFMLFNVNLWVMAIAGRRETFLKHKYIRSEGGYGHEDYAMNIELAAAGVPHRVVPGEVYFYREKQVSRRKDNDARRVTEPYSELFEPEFWRGFSEELVEGLLGGGPTRGEVLGSGSRERKSSESGSPGGRPMMGRLKKLYLQVRGNRVLMAVAEKVREVMSRRLLKELPLGVAEEWDKMAELEPMVGREVTVSGPGGSREGDSSVRKNFGGLRKVRKKVNAMGVRGVNPYCPTSMAYLKLCRSGAGFSEVDFEEISRGLDAEQSDLLMSRIMVQSRGGAKFKDGRCVEEWKDQHSELARGLGV